MCLDPDAVGSAFDRAGHREATYPEPVGELRLAVDPVARRFARDVRSQPVHQLTVERSSGRPFEGGAVRARQCETSRTVDWTIGRTTRRGFARPDFRRALSQVGGIAASGSGAQLIRPAVGRSKFGPGHLSSRFKVSCIPNFSTPFRLPLEMSG